MMRKILLLFALLGFTLGAAYAQTGKLAGKLIDKTTREPISFATVVVKLNGAQKGHGMTDISGNYSISPLTPGSYTVEAPWVGYNTGVVTGVQVNVDKTTILNIELAPSTTTEIGVIDVIAYKEPLIGPEKVGETITQEEIRKLPTREVATMAATTAGVQSSDDGKALNVKGTRSSGTVYYVNGVKQLTEPSIPANSISQMTVLTGGIPAQYGDATGGIINITTSSPSATIAGGIELATSAPFDQYNTNLGSFNLTGPIWKKRSADTTNFSENRTILGFFLGGQFQNSVDDNPSAQGTWMMNDATENEISKRPYVNVVDAGGNINKIDAGQLATFNNFQESKIRNNAKSMRMALNGAVDFQPKENIMFTVGGNYSHSDRNLYYNAFSLFNPENNPQQIIKNWNVYGRFTQNFNNTATDSGASTLKNAYYQIQFDFSKYDRVIQNEDLKNDVWRYGYIGKFTEDIYDQVDSLVLPVDGGGTRLFTNVNVNQGNKNGVTFQESGDNPLLAAYSRQVLDEAGGLGLSINNLDLLQFERGLLNGGSPSVIQNMYSGRGTIYPFYQLLNNDQYRVTALGAAELGKHTIKLGFEFEQRVETNYSINSNSLWNLGRGYLRTEFAGTPDKTKYTVTEKDGQTYIDFGYIPTGNQSTFSKNLREKLGVGFNGPINIDALSPEDLSVSMFSADELVNPGVVAYQGYTYDGKRNTKKVNFNDYFSDPNRPQDAVRPIYTSAFIEDKFQIEDLTLRAGVRIDRFDANQSVLKDPYSLVELLRAKDVRNLKFANNYSIPSNVGDDWAIYVNKSTADFDMGQSQTYTVTGYRSGDVFYDANGNPTENVAPIIQNGIFPLFDPNNQGEKGTEYITDRRLSIKAFKDYEPSITVNPRLSFSFPISEDALFFAHYDILTQRPERNGTLPSDYYFLLGSVGPRNEINNPDLKPQKKIDYEVGFEQRLSRSSSMSISAFYSEFRDQISARRFSAAYPQEYTTYGNLDFGTVKGMTLEFDQRASKNITLNASYTLQFAKGTGSSATTGLDAVNQGQPNLRTPMPLDFDQRHAFKVNFDFRFADDEGPVLFDKKIFQNAGINLILNAGSGEPYSRQANVTSYTNAIGRPVLAGSLNGSRKPANIRAGLRIDKDFTLNSKEGSNSFVKALNVYLRVQNLFNTMNVINVYRYTGSATDDGYLDTYRERNADNLDQALIDLYTIRLLNGNGNAGVGSNPTNYSLPRRAEIGAILSF